jgi:hypothetical protein
MTLENLVVTENERERGKKGREGERKGKKANLHYMVAWLW